MGNKRYINGLLDNNLNGTNFNNIPSETLFSFGKFSVTSNFDKATVVNYQNNLSKFARPITLDTIGITESQSDLIHNHSINAVLNLDNSNLNTFVKFGSAYEMLRNCVQNIIVAFPGSLFVNSQKVVGGNITFFNFQYDPLINESILYVPSPYIDNVFGLAFNMGNSGSPNNDTLKNLNLSYDKYIVWSAYAPNTNNCNIIGFTGDTSAQPYLVIKTQGNPFPFLTNTSQGNFDFHIKPNNAIFEEYRENLTDYEKYMISERDDINGFKFTLREPILLDDGNIEFSNTTMLWNTTDGYSIDINTPQYSRFLDSLLNIGTKYDTIKTDLIARFLSPSSLKVYDLTDEGKMTKLLRIYGREFDQLKEFIDSLVYINRVSYDKKNNIPDQLISNLAKTFGWDYFSLLNEEELMGKFLSIDDAERNLNQDLLPAEVNIELWRRILINTNYFWKSKGTRDSIRAMFLLIGIPEPFIDITEHVYTVNGKIDPRQVKLTAEDFPSNSLPFDNSGYPKAPLETNEFYFQVSGNTDAGQAYLNAFRKAGFELIPTTDNKKSWVQEGEIDRIHNTTPTYHQLDSKLVINTKEIDISLDTARGIEWDLWWYVTHIDYPANSTDYVQPFSFVNISIGLTGATQTTFKLPTNYNANVGDLEIRFNGILLNAPKTGTTTTSFDADYIINGNEFTLANGIGASMFNNNRDVVQATYLYSGGTITGATIKYIVTRVNADMTGTIIPLPNEAQGDVQVTINGIALTKTTNMFIADYVVDPYNPDQIIIQNPDVIAYLSSEPNVQVAYLTISGSSTITTRSEITRIDSFNSGKIYFNASANKYVYKLNYKVNNASEVKVLIDGLALEPNGDYTVSSTNPYELFLPNGLRFGSIISLYYIVGGDEYKNPMITNAMFGITDLGNLSFIEFIELIQRRLINAANRKTITDFKGGWYPTLLKVYITYLRRGNLSSGDPLHSNAYTFMNLYPFLSKYNAFFQRFVDELLSATIIIDKGGLLVRNSIFTRQKFTYKRGVYMGHIKHLGLDVDPTTYEIDDQLFYFGNDGSDFYKRQETKDIHWSNDFVCSNEECSLMVENINIIYPVNINVVFILGLNGSVYTYEPLTDTMTFRFTAPSDAREIANTENKLWLTGENRFIEYDITLDPFYVSNTFTEIPYSVNPGNGLIAKDNNTLVSINGNHVYNYGVNDTLVESIFSINSSRLTIGDIIYNANNDNYIAVNGDVGNSYITQYQSDGTILSNIPISQTDIVGLYQFGDELYAVKANSTNSSLYKIYSTGLTFEKRFSIKILGVSQNVDSITVDLPI